MVEIKRVAAPAHTSRPRLYEPKLVIIHATRGHISMDLQDESALSWFLNAPDRGGWGPTADYLVSTDGEAWQFRDTDRKHAAYSCGYGSLGPAYEYAADEYAVSIEIPQPAYEHGAPASAVPLFEQTSLRAAADVVRGVCDRYDIPVERVGSWEQLRVQPVPRGLIGHEDTANGWRTGKHDPGPAFPWPEFLAMVAQREAPPLSAGDVALIARKALPGLPAYARPNNVSITPQPQPDGRVRDYALQITG